MLCRYLRARGGSRAGDAARLMAMRARYEFRRQPPQPQEAASVVLAPEPSAAAESPSCRLLDGREVDGELLLGSDQ